ncbi:SGNH/GDSL hydrolase family protein [Capilliphycus salinus ALCB114379]|uniref:SGNH/GDSL hydrolase family protein n=1 Tax=Capilliphycus salinus TaxID=2768948 RepID=UPI0039A64F62
MKKIILSTGFALLSFNLSTQAEAASFSKLYVFGDSLSDSGNIFNVTTALNQIPPQLIPPGFEIPPPTPPVPPYDEDGRFSNGLVWVDYLAENLGLTSTPSTELSVLFPGSQDKSFLTLDPNSGELIISPFFNGMTATQSVNFAFGASQTGLVSAEGIPGLLGQVGSFINDLEFANQFADPEALYIVSSGPNDYQTVPNPNPEQSVSNIVTSIQALYNSGARNIMVSNLPNLGETPRALGPFAPVPSAPLSAVTQVHNSLLTEALNNLSLLPDINIIPVDMFSLYTQIFNDPEPFGFTTVTEACLSPDPSLFPNLTPPEGVTFTVCDRPDKYVFWDGIHPTTASHKVLAEFALAQLAQPESVPEPRNSIALGIFTLGGLLYKTRNSSKKC